MKLSIITVNFKCRGLLKNSLKGIFASRISVPFEVIVADNSPGDGTAEMIAAKFPQVRYLRNPGNIGFGLANNRAIAEAKGEYILILNPDICTFQGQFDAMLEYMEAHPDIGVLGARLMNPDKTTQVSCYRAPKWYTPIMRRTVIGDTGFGRREVARFMMSEFDRSSVCDVEWVQGSFMLVRSRLIAELGAFDDRYFMYFEDVDWCRRIREAGYRVVYYPHAAFVHYHRRDSDGGSLFKTLRRKTVRYHIVSWIKYVLKWGLATHKHLNT